jgi:hypothetical protein
MLRLDKHKRVWRAALLVLLIVAFIGPWAFEQINVPSKYPCSPPFIRLEGDFCGEPMSVMWILPLMIISGMIYSSLGLVTGDIGFITWVRQLLNSSFLFLLMLPIFTTILLIRGRDSRRWRIFHLIAWGLAGAEVLLLSLSNYSRQSWMLWGAWLYIGLAICALILEMLMLTARRRFNQEN